MASTDEIKTGLRRKRSRRSFSDDDYLSTGSTLLNLACSGRVDGGFVKGHYVLLVGDSTSGKTFLSLTCLAEANINPAFDDHRFIYDNAEGGALMNIRRFFGAGVADRMEPPAVDADGPVFSSTVEEFYYNVDEAAKVGRPFIFVEDSMDSLSSDAEADKFDERKDAHRKGRQAAGSYGDNKAKINSSHLRKVLGPLREMGSILIIINQTRDSFGLFGGKTRSGGHALRFYATLELWSSVKHKLQRTVRGKKRQLGVLCKIQVKKNRLTGRERVIELPIFHSHGIDDVGSCVDYLVGEGYWDVRTGKTAATGMGPTITAKRESLIRRIEDGDMQEDLRELVGMVWNSIEKDCEVVRKRRYR